MFWEVFDVSSASSAPTRWSCVAQRRDERIDELLCNWIGVGDRHSRRGEAEEGEKEKKQGGASELA